MDKKLLLVIFVMADIVSLLAMYNFNLWHYVSMDTSHITKLIIMLYLTSNALMAFIVFRYPKGIPHDIDDLDGNYAGKALGWIQENMTGLGLLGTILGLFVIFYQLFQNLDVTNATAMKEIMSQISTGVAIAALTTIAGIVCTMMLNFKLIWFDGGRE